ncbi:hypothetical protein N7478_007323 [Penicillium angulare]|uniref:uncharacterized protein n=1 Tax=Penicillium angulare TaxID=116970 RepID=UPI0025423F21|nr:uncharacterized protein N7478_007323 [Penicillium angulare]KAJ5281951.1 hypothetical protein N7478_007323 [Penicillium angulare]
MRGRGANGECGIAPVPCQQQVSYRTATGHSKPPEAARSRPTICAPHWDTPEQDTGRQGTRAIVAPVAWEMMGVSGPRTLHLVMAPAPSDW